MLVSEKHNGLAVFPGLAEDENVCLKILLKLLGGGPVTSQIRQYLYRAMFFGVVR